MTLCVAGTKTCFKSHTQSFVCQVSFEAGSEVRGDGREAPSWRCPKARRRRRVALRPLRRCRSWRCPRRVPLRPQRRCRRPLPNGPGSAKRGGCTWNYSLETSDCKFYDMCTLSPACLLRGSPATRRSRFCFSTSAKQVVLTLKREPGGIVLEVADPVTQPLCKAPPESGLLRSASASTQAPHETAAGPTGSRPGLLRRHEGR